MKAACSRCGSLSDISLQNSDRQSIECPDCRYNIPVDNPNLQPCADCYHLISKRAAACPHCGAVLMKSAVAGTGRNIVADDLDNILEEKEIMICHPSAMSFIFEIIYGVLLSVLLIGIVMLISIWIRIKFTTYKISNKRIVVESGLFSKIRNEIWIKDMRGVTMNRSLWKRIIGVGDIDIGTAATGGTEIQLKSVKDPDFIVDLINSLRAGR